MKLPDSISKRELLYGEKGEKADLSAYGDAFMSAKRYQDAFLFFVRAKDDSKLRELRKVSIEKGNLNILARIHQIQGHEISSAEFAEAGKNAFERGLLRYAVQLYERAGMPERAAEIKAIYEPPVIPPAANPEQGAKKDNAQDKSADN